MSSNNIANIKHHMLEILAVLNESETAEIAQWISNNTFRKDLHQMKSLQALEKTLIGIGNSLKEIVPFEAQRATENVVQGILRDEGDFINVNTVVVDEFLYNQYDDERLVKKGKLQRNYCMDCTSRNVEELIYISHSLSHHAVQYIFKVLLPSDLKKKQILDVGSGFGAVLYLWCILLFKCYNNCRSRN